MITERLAEVEFDQRPEGLRRGAGGWRVNRHRGGGGWSPDPEASVLERKEEVLAVSWGGEYQGERFRVFPGLM